MGTGKLSAKSDEIQGGYSVKDWHPIQGGEVILLVTPCNRNWD